MQAKQFIEIDYTKEKHILQVYPRLPVISSKGDGQDIHLRYYQQPAHATPSYSPKQYIISINVGKPIKLKLQQSNGHCRQAYIDHGESCIYSANYTFRESWNRDIEFIELYLEPAVITRVAHEYVDLDRVEILPHFTINDPFLYQIGRLLKAEIEPEENGKAIPFINRSVYFESITKTLILHLFKQYSTSRKEAKNNKKGLSSSALREVLLYIDQHLEEDLSLVEIANIIPLSAHYFATLFKEATGKTLFQYITQRRIECAKELLAREKASIIDICYQVGFKDQSYFAKVFRKYTGFTPKAYRNSF